MINALVDDHWVGRTIEDLAEECDAILRDPLRQRKVLDALIVDLRDLGDG